MNLLVILQSLGDGKLPMDWIFIGGMIIIFYLFMIRPQQKKAKEQKKFKESVSKGDRIVTIGGLHGKVAEVKDTTVIIETEGGNRLKIEKSAISMEFSSGTTTEATGAAADTLPKN